MDPTTSDSHHGHLPNLAHHFDTPEQQYDSGKMGMWIFLATEILLFAGLFCAYAVYRAIHPEIFIYAHQFLDKNLGAVNTVVLLCSSFTMAWAVRCAQLGKKRALVILLSLTMLGGFGFMSIKYVEYKHKWQHGLLWGERYHPLEHGGSAGETHTGGEVREAVSDVAAVAQPAAVGAGSRPGAVPTADSTALPPAGQAPSGTRKEGPAERTEHGELEVVPENVQIFFSVYFLMTGLHGLHVLMGLGAIGYLIVRSARGHFGPSYFTPVDLVGLYWHLVDLIWIFLFPLLYLIR